MQAISKNQIKFIRSLAQLKYRREHKAYLVEGHKSALEWLAQAAPVRYIVAAGAWYAEHENALKAVPGSARLLATQQDFEKISTLKTPPEVMLVVEQQEHAESLEIEAGEWVLMLDKVQDPGNFGTIVRTADWFGIRQIVCSPDCVEQYNPKVVQSTMGSLLRVQCHYQSLTEVLDRFSELPAYAAVLGGEPLEQLGDAPPGFIIMGNESNGISDAVQEKTSRRITISRIGGAESLNVSVATGIICHQLLMG